MQIMNFDKWYKNAEKQVAKMSPRMMIAMIVALNNRIGGETNEELIHLDTLFDELKPIASHYDIEMVLDYDE